MIYITGDTHAQFDRFTTKNFPQQKEMTKDDYVIICGDFGGIWKKASANNNNEEEYWLDWLENKPFTTLFVDGNHENFDRLKLYPRKRWNNGKVHVIRPSVLHLMRGYVFNIEDKSFFAFGGGKSHDIQDGILDIKHYNNELDMFNDYKIRTYYGYRVRINHYSWWKDELPTRHEMNRGIENLKKVGFNVDYVISHCLPSFVSNSLFENDSDKLTDYFSDLVKKYGLRFNRWFSGHYHLEKELFEKYEINFTNIKRIN